MNRWQRLAAWAWLAISLGAAADNGRTWLARGRALETDLLALLPAADRDPVVRTAFAEVAEASQQDAVILIGASDWDLAVRAAAAYEAVLATDNSVVRSSPAAAAVGDLDALAPWWEARAGILATADRERLRSAAPAALAQDAMRELMSPVGAGRLGAWQEDPFGLFQHWLRERATDSPVRPVDGRLRVDVDSMRFVVLPLRLKGESFRLRTQERVIPLLDAARDSALAEAPGIAVHSAGVIFPAAAAASRAQREFSMIGVGSIIGISLMAWGAFRSFRPIILLLFSALIASNAALAVTARLFDEVHLITLVFGASLIGIAQDYGLHFLCARERRERGSADVMRQMTPGFALALVTTLAAFAMLAATPFPGLRQMAAFAIVGLSAAWLTVVLWFPVLDSGSAARPHWVSAFGRVRVVWESAVRKRPAALALALLGVLVVLGLFRLRPDDDVRLLHGLPEAVIAEQARVGEILEQPFGGQFFVVRGGSEGETLEREEALRERLDALEADGQLGGYAAVSTWVPSPQRQRANRKLVEERILGPSGAAESLRGVLGESPAWREQLARAARGSETGLSIARWQASPLSQPLRPLWLGVHGTEMVSVVTLKNVDITRVPELTAVAAALDGVDWVDQVASITGVLRRYREQTAWVLAAAYLAVWLLFLPRYGRRAWRVLAPSAVGSVAALGAVGLLGQPLQLFHILGLYLVFGIGVDSAIFLSERIHTHREDAWFAIGLATTSTALSLGLLALSTTPVLRAFGLVLLVGVVASMATAPLVCRAPS